MIQEAPTPLRDADTTPTHRPVIFRKVGTHSDVRRSKSNSYKRRIIDVGRSKSNSHTEKIQTELPVLNISIHSSVSREYVTKEFK